MNNQIAFSFLLDLKKAFLKAFSHEKIYDSIAFGLNSFGDSKMKKLMDEYSHMITKPNKNNGKLKVNFIDETKILNENASLINENKQKVSIICEKAENLIDRSHQYYEEVTN